MGGGWGLFGDGMGLWGLLWMGLLTAVPRYLVVAFARRGGEGADERSLSVLRERYACGDSRTTSSNDGVNGWNVPDDPSGIGARRLSPYSATILDPIVKSSNSERSRMNHTIQEPVSGDVDRMVEITIDALGDEDFGVLCDIDGRRPE